MFGSRLHTPAADNPSVGRNGAALSSTSAKATGRHEIHSRLTDLYRFAGEYALNPSVPAQIRHLFEA
jgi:hypothetical protein